MESIKFPLSLQVKKHPSPDSQKKKAVALHRWQSPTTEKMDDFSSMSEEEEL